MLARVPGDERGLQQLERQQMGTFSAGAAPPLPQPGSLSPSSTSSAVTRKHSAFLGLGVETVSAVAVPPLITWWVLCGSLQGKLQTDVQTRARSLCSSVGWLDLTFPIMQIFGGAACLRPGV